MQEITPADRCTFQRYLLQEPEPTVEYCFASLYAWSHKAFDRFDIWRDWLLLILKGQDDAPWLMPYGPPDCREAVLEMKRRHAERFADKPFRLLAVTERSKQRLTEWFGDSVSFRAGEGTADYLYSADDLRNLAGKKYHSKRNFIARFLRTYEGRWSHEPVTKQNVDELWAFERQWAHENDSHHQQSVREEIVTLYQLLPNMEALGAKGRLLRVDGKVAAFTLGAPCGGNAVDVMSEKADYDIVGAYPMINQLFLLHDWPDVSFVNREEDLGLEGLRKSKESYYPVQLLTKYEATFHD